MLMNSDAGRPWGAVEPRESKLVFDCRNPPEAALRAALESCLMPRLRRGGDRSQRTNTFYSKSIFAPDIFAPDTSLLPTIFAPDT